MYYFLCVIAVFVVAVAVILGPMIWWETNLPYKENLPPDGED